MQSLQGFHCLFVCLLRHHTIFSRFPLFHYRFVTSLLCSRPRLALPLFVTSVYSLFKIFIVSLPVCYVTILSLQCFHCFIIRLLRHRFVLDFDCYFICFIRHLTISSKYPIFHYLFVTSLICSSLRLSLSLFVTSLFIQAISIAPLKANHYSEALQTQHGCVEV